MSSSPSHPGQLSLSPSAERETRISQSAVMLCGWEWQVKLCDASLTRAIRDSLRDKQLIIKRYTNEAYFTFTVIFVLDPAKVISEAVKCEQT